MAHRRAAALAPFSLGAAVVAAAIGTMAVPVAAECSFNVNRWPSFEEVAPTAKTVVIGTVIQTAAHDQEPLYNGFSPVFTLEVEDVLRGDAPEAIEFNGLRSGVPLRGERSCRQNSVMYAKLDDRIAVAFDGKVQGLKDRVTTATWIEGRPNNEISNPGLGTMELNEVRQVLGMELLPSFRAVVSGELDSVADGTLTLDGVSAVAFESDWPLRSIGRWTVASFIEGWVRASEGEGVPHAVLQVAASDGREDVVVPLAVDPNADPVAYEPAVEVLVMAIRADGDTVSLDVTPAEALPDGAAGPVSLFLDIDADPSTWGGQAPS